VGPAQAKCSFSGPASVQGAQLLLGEIGAHVAHIGLDQGEGLIALRPGHGRECQTLRLAQARFPARPGQDVAKRLGLQDGHLLLRARQIMQQRQRQILLDRKHAQARMLMARRHFGRVRAKERRRHGNAEAWRDREGE
jgi:hypothetical protein